MSDIDRRLLLLHPDDNVLVCCQTMDSGTELSIEGRRCVLEKDLGLGHKIARRDISVAEKILRSGAAIGSATESIGFGQHVHMHNMKSDYIATHYRDAVEGLT